MQMHNIFLLACMFLWQVPKNGKPFTNLILLSYYLIIYLTNLGNTERLCSNGNVIQYSANTCITLPSLNQKTFVNVNEELFLFANYSFFSAHQISCLCAQNIQRYSSVFEDDYLLNVLVISNQYKMSNPYISSFLNTLNNQTSVSS